MQITREQAEQATYGTVSFRADIWPGHDEQQRAVLGFWTERDEAEQAMTDATITRAPPWHGSVTCLFRGQTPIDPHAEAQFIGEETRLDDELQPREYLARVPGRGTRREIALADEALRQVTEWLTQANEASQARGHGFAVGVRGYVERRKSGGEWVLWRTLRIAESGRIVRADR